MNLPGAALTTAPVVVPVPVPALLAGVQPRASKSFNHVAGVIVGNTATYADLNACAWFKGGNWGVRNQKRLMSARTLNGTEDGQCRKAD